MKTQKAASAAAAKNDVDDGVVKHANAPKQRRAEGPRFSALDPPLRAASLELLAQQGFERATPVQASAIGLLAGNKDVAVEACTGSGKTLAFVLPMVEILARSETTFRKHQVGAVIVSPTRELARQIYDVAVPFLATVKGAPPMLLVGGTDVSVDVRSFAEDGALALIGTPGRLDDLMVRSKALDCKRVELLVLDEADRLLSMGFVKTLNAIIARLPKQRRTGLFSATQTEEVEELARAGLRNPVRVTVRDAAAHAAAAAARAAGAPPSSAAARGKLPAQLRLLYKICHVDERLWRLREFLREHADRKVIVYFLTCACVDYFAAALEPGGPANPNTDTAGNDERVTNADQKKTNNKKSGGGGGGGGGGGIVGSKRTAAADDEAAAGNVVALHGKMKQSQREAALAEFAAAGAGGCLLCTDVAARGLDIPGVDWVVQFDAPQDPAAFVHRVGRTARMGRRGSALLFLAPHEASYVEFLRVRHIDVEPLGGARDALGDNGGGGGGDGGVGKAAGRSGVAAKGRGEEEEAGEEAGEEEEEDSEGEDEEGEEEEADEEDEHAADEGDDGGDDDGAEEEEEEEEEEDPEAAAGSADLCAALLARSESNREAMEKGVRAFVSYIRGYKEHHCRFIFRFKELPLARLARSMGLLRLPRMKEIRKASASSLRGFVESGVNPEKVPYADKARERQRVKALEEEAAARAANPEVFKSDSRKEKERKKREDAAAAAEKAKTEKRMTAAKRRQAEAREDFDDINDDYRALKKLKRGKISEEEFDFELGFEQEQGGGGRAGAGAGAASAAASASDDVHRGGKRMQQSGALHGAAAKAAEKKPRPNKPRHIKGSKAKGGGRGAKAMKKKKFAK